MEKKKEKKRKRSLLQWFIEKEAGKRGRGSIQIKRDKRERW